MCVRTCASVVLVYSQPATGHLKGRSVECVSLWALSALLVLAPKEQPSASHLKGRSVVWERRWTLRDCLTRVE